jgi:hypothetical protein
MSGIEYRKILTITTILVPQSVAIEEVIKPGWNSKHNLMAPVVDLFHRITVGRSIAQATLLN